MANKTDHRTLQLIKKKAVSGGGGGVTSVNGNTGVVVLASDDISDAAQAHKFVTAANITALGTLTVDLAAKQPLDASLTAYANLVTAANQIVYYSGADVPVVTTISVLGRNLIDDGNTASMQTTLALVPGTNIPAFSFTKVAVAGQSDVDADSVADTLTLAAGSNITLTTNAGTDTVTIAASGGGSASITEVEIDFGSTPVKTKVFAITDATVAATDKVIAFQSGKAATGRVTDENEMDAIIFNTNPLAGSFTLRAQVLTGTVVGKYKVNYMRAA
jgi:hypothetical protein